VNKPLNLNLLNFSPKKQQLRWKKKRTYEAVVQNDMMPFNLSCLQEYIACNNSTSLAKLEPYHLRSWKSSAGAVLFIWAVRLFINGYDLTVINSPVHQNSCLDFPTTVVISLLWSPHRKYPQTLFALQNWGGEGNGNMDYYAMWIKGEINAGHVRYDSCDLVWFLPWFTRQCSVSVLDSI
jgi:hypothetical protein